MKRIGRFNASNTQSNYYKKLFDFFDKIGINELMLFNKIVADSRSSYNCNKGTVHIEQTEKNL